MCRAEVKSWFRHVKFETAKSSDSKTFFFFLEAVGFTYLELREEAWANNTNLEIISL